MSLVGSDRPLQAGALPVGQVLFSGSQDGADPVQRVPLAAAVPVDLLLNPAAHVVDGLGAELDHMEGNSTRTKLG